MDLVVNGAVKPHLRKRRIELTFDSFGLFRAQYFQAKYENKSLPKFKPPIPELEDNLIALEGLKKPDGLFHDPKFRDSVLQSHIKVCLKRTISSGHLSPHFVRYVDTGNGTTTNANKREKLKVPKKLSDRACSSEFSLGTALLNVMSHNESI